MSALIGSTKRERGSLSAAVCLSHFLYHTAYNQLIGKLFIANQFAKDALEAKQISHPEST